MRATIPEAWIAYFDARFHPPIVTLDDLHARGWSQSHIHRHLGFTPNVTGVVKAERFSDVQIVRAAFRAGQDSARPQHTELALAMIEKAHKSFEPIDISVEDAIAHGYEFDMRRLEANTSGQERRLSRDEWLAQGDSSDAWHWPAYWIERSIEAKDQALDEAGAFYARACLSMLGFIDRARRFADIPGATKWYWCEWTRVWKEMRPAGCDRRWGEDDILPPFDRNVVKWPEWPADLKVTPPI